MDRPRPEWPNLIEFESTQLSTAQECELLLYEIFDKSRRLNDEDRNYVTEEGAIYSFPVDSAEDEQGVCYSLRLRECRYAPQTSHMDAGVTQVAYSMPVSPSPTSARAYVVEMARLDYDSTDINDPAMWRNFALIISTAEGEEIRNTELLDSATGEDLTPLLAQKLKMILSMMDAALREEMASQMLLIDPLTEAVETSETDFYPDDYISGYSCDSCIQGRLLCTHIRPTFN
jgi:hypothetical protein